MVQINKEVLRENESALEVAAIAKTEAMSGNKEPLESNRGPHELAAPDMELVVKAREALRCEFLNKIDELSQLYSMEHYDELMEADAPYTCWRYILYCQRNVTQAVDLMRKTLIWRKENRIDVMQPRELMKDFWLRAPMGFTGKTNDGHDLIYVVGKNYKKPDGSIQQRIREFVAFLLFEWDRKHRYDLEQMTLVFDVSDTGFRNFDLSFSAWLTEISDYIPARVHAVNIVGIPYLMRPMVRMIVSWLPERFRRITYCGSFDELVAKNIDQHSIPVEVGGKAPDTWRLAPVDSSWCHESDLPNSDKVFEKICQCCSFNTSQEHLDKLYQMQRDYENKIAAAL